VCAGGCCCGRTENGHPAVPADVYHAEWERRGLRDVVHLTIGGCLGPCALANVALLILDGEALWLHSMNRPELVLALYDHLEARLGEGPAALPAVLAPLAFRAFAWSLPAGGGAPPG
jgi:cobaltochelatase CobN